jgi:hypothetical protein
MLVREVERAQERRGDWEKRAAETTQDDSCDSQDCELSDVDATEQSQIMPADALHGQAAEIEPQDQIEVDSSDAAIAKQTQFDVAVQNESSQQGANGDADKEQVQGQSAKQSQLESAVVYAEGEPAPKKPSQSVAAEDSAHRPAIEG